ncbi:MAG TPA: hypothetical protein VIP27_01075 [Variovorax sp.]
MKFIVSGVRTINRYAKSWSSLSSPVSLTGSSAGVPMNSGMAVLRTVSVRGVTFVIWYSLPRVLLWRLGNYDAAKSRRMGFERDQFARSQDH